MWTVHAPALCSKQLLRNWVLIVQLRRYSLAFLGVVDPVDIVNNGDGTHTVVYTPTQEGPYMISVKYADEEIPRR